MASKQNADKPQRKRTQRFNHPFPSVTRGHREHRAILTCFSRCAYTSSSVLSVSSSAAGGKKNHVGSSCHQYLPIRLMYKSEGREHGQESPALMCDVVGRASRRGRVMLQPKTQHGLCYAKNRVLHQNMPRLSVLLA